MWVIFFDEIFLDEIFLARRLREFIRTYKVLLLFRVPGVPMEGCVSEIFRRGEGVNLFHKEGLLSCIVICM